MKIEKDIFIDTSALIAMRVEDDINHKEAQHFLSVIREKRLRLHTTNFILDEGYTYFCKSHAIAIEMAELIMDNPLILLNRVTVEDEKRAIEILEALKDKNFSYTDATSFAVMERLEINTAFAFDEHFTQYGRFIVVP